MYVKMYGLTYIHIQIDNPYFTSTVQGQVYVVAVDDGAVLNTLDGIQLVGVGLFSPLCRSTQAVEVYANQHSVRAVCVCVCVCLLCVLCVRYV